jgi:O-antigen ligase
MNFQPTMHKPAATLTGPAPTYSLKVLAVLVPALFFLFPMWPAPSNIVLLLVVIAFLFTINRSYWNFSEWPAAQKILLALFVVVAFGCLYSSATWEWMSLHLSKYAKFVYAAALILLLRDRAVWQQRAHGAFVAAMVFILVSTWLNVWFILPWSTTSVTGFGVSHHVFGDYITQNALMSYLIAYASVQIKKKNHWIYNLWWSAILIFGLFSITHLSMGRTGFVLAVVGLTTVLVMRTKLKVLKWLLPTFFFILIGLLSSSNMLRDRFELGMQELLKRDVNNETSIGHRAYNYKITPTLIAKNPIVGHGTGAYHTEICTVMSDPQRCDEFSWHPHNQFLFFGADHGLVGMFLYMALIVSLYKLAYSKRGTSVGQQLMAFTSILLINSLINSPLWSSRESQFFCFVMALLIAMCSQPQSVKLHEHRT